MEGHIVRSSLEDFTTDLITRSEGLGRPLKDLRPEECTEERFPIEMIKRMNFKGPEQAMYGDLVSVGSTARVADMFLTLSSVPPSTKFLMPLREALSTRRTTQ